MLQIPVSSRAHQPYESRLGTCRICKIVFFYRPCPSSSLVARRAQLLVAKGRLALPRPIGHDILSVARLLIPPLGYVSDP